jgi:hypothetical protein
MRTELALLTVVAGALVACSPNNDVTTPNADAARFGDGIPGAYALQSVSGKSLPADVVTNEYVRVASVADTLFLFENGTGANVSVERITDEAHPQGVVRRWEAFLKYTLDGNRLSVEYYCNDVIVLASCAAPPHLRGTFDAAGLNVDFAMQQRVPQRFTKVAGPSAVASVEISPLDRLTLKPGATLQLAAAVRDAAGNTVSGKNPTWRTIITGAATVTNAGVVRGVTKGITLVTAFVDGRADTVTVHVEP